MNRWIDTQWKDRQIDRQIQAKRHCDIETYGHRDIVIARQMEAKIEIDRYRQIDCQIDKKKIHIDSD